MEEVVHTRTRRGNPVHANAKYAAHIYGFLLVTGSTSDAYPRWSTYNEAGGDLLVATSQWKNGKLYPVLIPTIKHKMNNAVVGDSVPFNLDMLGGGSASGLV
eukprot:132411-Chlamydomonas_euryale.AAC.1